ncbi:MAG TPA: sigma factor-like helix-turn-helix DNA-binding protein [Conexibacter sp.]|nr:sigma factor-like helix-turn-helix DNA-binding protein [Conexibacter sp.]
MSALVAQRRLERAVARLQACLSGLTERERRILTLRAGLGPGPALSRAQVARLLDLSLTRTGQIERRGLRRLGALDRAGRCAGGGGVSTAWLWGSASGSTPLLATPTGGMEHAADPASRPRFGIEGVIASGGGSGRGSGFDALPPPLGHGSDETLLILLALLAALGLLVRWELRRH